MSQGGTSTQTTHNALPKWAVPYAQQLLGIGANTFFPGGQVGQMPKDLNQQVAGMTPDQIMGINDIQQASGAAPLNYTPSTANLPSGLLPGTSPAPGISGLNAPIPNPSQPIPSGNPPDPIPNPVTNPTPKKKAKK